MKKIKQLLAVLLAVVLLLTGVFAGIGSADFGDYGGDYDFGGGDYGGGDYGGNDWGDNDWGDNDYGGSTSRSSSEISGGELAFYLIFFVLVIVLAILGDRKNNRARRAKRGKGGQATDKKLLRPMSDYKKLDPGFSEEAMCKKLSDLYVELQNAWHNKDLEPLRPLLSDAFYAQSEAQLQHYIRDHQTSFLENIAVLDVRLSGFVQESGKDVLVAQLSTRFVNYVLHDETGALVRGSRTAEKYMEYEWRLERTSGRVTGKDGGKTVHTCPNCGAQLDINRTARCAYCGSLVEVDSFDWVISGITGLSQRTVEK